MAPTSSKRAPPALPPRRPSIHETAPDPEEEAPPSYDSIMASNLNTNDPSWPTQDPRRSSTQSLPPAEPFNSPRSSSSNDTRRKLLLIYIHGFMGNETSFRSFPAHVHNLLTLLMAETHVVHSKIYPRYRSKRHIRHARDDFSEWLRPHEGSTTDVILLGHSMGGLLSAEVALMPTSAEAPADGGSGLKHRLLGTINLDVPFLGMHPGVVKSGLASIFYPPDEPKDHWSNPSNELTEDFLTGTSSSTANDSSSSMANPSELSTQHSQTPSIASSRSDTFWAPQQIDPNFNPSFTNDVVLPMRVGWRNAWHFVNKHSDDLFQASKKLVSSHLEFGGAMANYGELKARYSRIRGLEIEDLRVRASMVGIKAADEHDVPRVRFINYYTACTGRPRPKVEANPANGEAAVTEREDGEGLPGEGSKVGADSRDEITKATTDGAGSSSESILSEAITTTDTFTETLADEDFNEAAESLTIGDGKDSFHTGTTPMERLDPQPLEETDQETALSPSTTLQPIPPNPAAPAPLDVSSIQNPATRKLVEKEHERAVKAYEKAVRDRDRLLRDRAKLEVKRQRNASRAAEKTLRDDERAHRKGSTDAEKARLKRVEDEEKAERKRAEKERKMSAKEGKLQRKELSHSQKEELRLEKERLRMEAEGRRLRGEKSPERPSPASPAVVDHEDAAQSLEDSSKISRTENAVITPQISNANSHQQATSSTPDATEEGKPPPKDRTFCVLPPKDSTGQRDPCWVRIFMKDVDEVGAHCGLFFVDERYERLVGEVAERVEEWVREDQSLRSVRGEKN